MSRHRLIQTKNYNTKDLDDEYYDEDYGSYGSPMSPSSQMYMYGNRNQTYEEPKETDDEILDICLGKVYEVLGEELEYTDDEMVALARKYNYSSQAVINEITGGNKKKSNSNDDDMFSMDDGGSVNLKSSGPPPGFAPIKSPNKQQGGPSNLGRDLSDHPINNSSSNKVFSPNTTLDTLANEPSPDDEALAKQKQAFKRNKEDTKATTPNKNQGSGTPKKENPPPANTGKRKLNVGPKKGTNVGPSQLSQDLSAMNLGSKLASPTPDKNKSISPSSSGSTTPLSGSTDQITNQRDLMSSSGGIKKPQIIKQMPDAKRAKILKELSDAKPEKTHLNMVVIGHVDAGKSTMMGHLLYLNGNVSKQVIDRHEHDSRQRGKATFHFAWVLDQHEEERERGVTIDVATSYFETKKHQVTLLDAPGHKDFIPNMISGAAQADVAILVVNASSGEFERGISDHGQTKEHAILARSLGVSQIIVAINKMDTCDWNQSRYDHIANTVSSFLKKSGFKEVDIKCIPVSGLTGENLTKQKENNLLSWYKGNTLIQQIDEFTPPKREVDRPFRMCVHDVYKDGSNVGVGGKVESGFLSTGDRLSLMPYSEQCTVKSIKINGQVVEYATAGTNVDITITGIDQNALGVGSILCDPEQPVPVSRRVKAQILTLALETPLMKGKKVIFYSHNLEIPAKLANLESILDKSTGEIKQKRPRIIGDRTTAIVEIETDKPICVELYAKVRSLGRFMLREGGATLAAGIVTEIFSISQPPSQPNTNSNTK